ncbi:MAG TPA: LuxR C-terminal-related transcriptional regulator [Lacunisphaera sp.]|nr:LuxR C-terminal-related transcriptional regulator [Lacunisphaera sp.]
MLQEQQRIGKDAWTATAYRQSPLVEPAGLAFLVGRLEVTAFLRRGTDFHISLRRREPAPASPLRARDEGIIESLLAGRSQKQISYELGVSATTVSEAIQRVLRRVGLARWEHLVAIGCALRAGERGESDGEWLDHSSANPLQLFATVSPGAISRLTVAELDIALHIIDGWSSARISRSRGTSLRTIANQISSASQKLRVRGRLELILRLFCNDSPS